MGLAAVADGGSGRPEAARVAHNAPGPCGHREGVLAAGDEGPFGRWPEERAAQA